MCRGNKAKETKKMNDSELLKQYVRFETGYDYFGSDQDEIEFAAFYEPDYRDIVVAIDNLVEKKATYEVLSDWYSLVEDNLSETLANRIELPLGIDHIWSIDENDVFKAMMDAIWDILVYDELYDDEQKILDALMSVKDIEANYHYNKEHDIADWKLTKWQKELITQYYCDKEDSVSNSRRPLFKKIVEEGCEEDDFVCMRIKGYSCYGGNKLYDCDWDESCRLITKLFDKTGDPIYANTLGYIYYYGRCNGGTPEYEKAFQYFSVGAAYGLFESTYKISDMFLNGKGIIKSVKTSDHLISKLYYDSLSQFCAGSDAKFADIALRKASAWERAGIFESALDAYLEADFAIKKRMKHTDFFGDKKVADSISKGLESVKDKLGADYFKDKVEENDPYWLDMLMDGNNTKIKIENIGDNHYKLKASVKKKEDDCVKKLIVIPEIEYVSLTRKLEFDFYADDITYDVSKEEPIFINSYVYDFNGNIVFYNKNKKILTIKNGKYIFEKKK